MDLGLSPCARIRVEARQLGDPECLYPLHAWVCHVCYLVQLEDLVPSEEIYRDGEYSCFSSESASWLRHAESYARQATERFGLDRDSRVIEIASNDGYLLQFFAERGIPRAGHRARLERGPGGS